MKLTTKEMIYCALFASILCILSPICIPIGTVPVTLSLFVIGVISSVLGSRKAVISTLIYIFVGALGLPVFSMFQGGFSVLFGASGGFIFSYPLFAFLCGYFFNKYKTNSLYLFVSNILALSITYIIGTIQFILVCKTSILQSLAVCVYPFLLFDTIKIWASVKVSVALNKKITRLLNK